jgi:pimeloyl-ACP methyl ester carboxylesterase
MHQLTQFEIPFLENFPIKGEYEGNQDAKRLVIFAHGFGVKRNSWGMFNEIGDMLKERSMVVRFDFNQINTQENATHVVPCSLQSRMLDQVIDKFTLLFSPENTSLIAHSMGCVVAGLLQPKNIQKTVLLAPPTTSPYKRLVEYFSKRPGSRIDENKESVIERSDGSWTYIPSEFWSEIKTIEPQELYNNHFAKTNLYAVKPLQDQVIINEDYSDLKRLLNEKYIEIEGSHDFHPPHRQKLLDTIGELL